MTLSEISYSVKEALEPRISDDNPVDMREIQYEISNQRALWLRNELNKGNRGISENTVQTLCVGVSLASSSECCGDTLKCKVLRTDAVIPPFLRLNNAFAVTRVGPVDLTKPAFNWCDMQQAIYGGNGRFNKDAVFAFTHRGYVYLFVNPKSIYFSGIKKIAISAIFEDPMTIYSFEGCSGTCYGDDSPYPLDKWMWNYIKAEVIKSFVPDFYTSGDIRNDATSKPLSNGAKAYGKEISDNKVS